MSEKEKREGAREGAGAQGGAPRGESAQDAQKRAADAGAQGGAPRGTRRTQENVLSAVCAVALALTFFACGLVTCCLPITTQVLAGATCNTDKSPYAQDELISLAEATRDFTVDDYGRADVGEEGARDALAREVLEAARVAADPASPTADRWSAPARATLASLGDNAGAEGMQTLAEVSQSYALDEAALSHLTDVNEVIARFTPSLLGIAVLAAFCLMATLRLFGARPVGRALLGAGAGVLAAFLLLGAWALAGFDGFFAAFHSLFFADGTWTFPSDSLLICMYPTAFWMGMGGVWLATSCALSILSGGLGLVMLRRQAGAAAQDTTTN